MLKSLSEFQNLSEADLVRAIECGPLVVTQNEEPRFVTQTIDAFEAMVRRLRELESSKRRDRPRLAQVIRLPR